MSKYTEKELLTPPPEAEQKLIGDVFDNWDDFDKLPEHADKARKSAYMSFYESILDLKQHWIDEHEATQAADDQYNTRRG